MIKQEIRKPKVQKRHKTIRVKLSGTGEFLLFCHYNLSPHLIYSGSLLDLPRLSLSVLLSDPLSPGSKTGNCMAYLVCFSLPEFIVLCCLV